MTAGKTPCGIAIPQVFSDTAVDINLIQQFVQAETLGYDSLWVQESLSARARVGTPQPPHLCRGSPRACAWAHRSC